MTDKLITVASFSTDFEAEIARGKLQSSGRLVSKEEKEETHESEDPN
jgi:hypothetical protein